MALANDFYDCTWGTVRLWCARISSSGGRTQVVHELAETANGEHPVQDRGPSIRRWTCSVLFVDMPREPVPPMARFLAFKKQIDDGDRLIFTHPIEGSCYVNVGECSYELDEDGNLEGGTASIEFIKSADAETPVQAGSGTSASAGEVRIGASALNFADALADFDIESDLADRAIAAQDTWSAGDEVPSRQVIVDVAELSQGLNDLIEDEGLEDDLDLWEAFKATILLGDAIRSSALAALSETPRVTGIMISTPVSVLALAVRLYGGADAEDRVRQILALNDIRTPAWISVGSVITVPVPRSSSLRAG